MATAWNDGLKRLGEVAKTRGLSDRIKFCFDSVYQDGKDYRPEIGMGFWLRCHPMVWYRMASHTISGMVLVLLLLRTTGSVPLGISQGRIR